MSLRSSFGVAAEDYARYRPDYATDAVRWALEAAPGRRVLDLGAGTGKLTAGLVDLGLDVVAAEPDAAMLDQLRAALPTVPAHLAGAEAIPLEDGSVDAVLAGNALHWFDPVAAGPEIARVLSPGGALAGLWNLLDDDVAWVAGLAEVAGPAVVGPRDTPTSWRVVSRELVPPGFGSVEQAEFPHAQTCTADSLVATLATRAGVLALPDTERVALLAGMRGYLADRPETAHGAFELPMRTGVLRARRS